MNINTKVIELTGISYFSQQHILKRITKDLVEKNIDFKIISNLPSKTFISRLP